MQFHVYMHVTTTTIKVQNGSITTKNFIILSISILTHLPPTPSPCCLATTNIFSSSMVLVNDVERFSCAYFAIHVIRLMKHPFIYFAYFIIGVFRFVFCYCCYLFIYLLACFYCWILNWIPGLQIFISRCVVCVFILLIVFQSAKVF